MHAHVNLQRARWLYLREIYSSPCKTVTKISVAFVSFAMCLTFTTVSPLAVKAHSMGHRVHSAYARALVRATFLTKTAGDRKARSLSNGRRFTNSAN